MLSLVSLRALNVAKQSKINPIIVRTLKEKVPVQWNRPERLQKASPARTGDLGVYVEPEQSNIILDFQYADELNDAEPNVRNQYTLGWNKPKYTRQFYEKTLMDTVKSHVYDYDSPAVKIAQMTAVIRYNQHFVYGDLAHGYKRRMLKLEITFFAGQRRKMLTDLRFNDYRQFEWLLERLDLSYKPKPETQYQIAVSRKEGLRQMTKLHCDAVIQAKLDEYKNKLEAQQLPFLEQKIQNLKFIRNEEIELGLQQTIHDEDIQEIQKKYDELKVMIDAKTEAPTKKKWKVY